MGKRCILLVEDEAITAMAQSQILIEAGFEVIDAGTAEEALRKIENYNFNLVLMDVNLGAGLNGIGTAEIITANYKIPVLFLTSDTGFVTIINAGTAMPYDYLIKGINHLTLVETIKTAINNNLSLITPLDMINFQQNIDIKLHNKEVTENEKI